MKHKSERFWRLFLNEYELALEDWAKSLYPLVRFDCLVLADRGRRAIWSYPNGSSSSPKIDSWIALEKAGELRGWLGYSCPPKKRTTLESASRWLSETVDKLYRLESLCGELLTTQEQLATVLEMSERNRDQLDMEGLALSTISLLRSLRFCEESAMVFSRFGVVSWISKKGQLVHEGLRRYLLKSLTESEACLESDFIHIPIIRDKDFCCSLGAYRPLKSQFSHHDFQLVTVVGSYLQSKIESLLLHHRTINQARVDAQLEMAKQVQRQLIPGSYPKIKGLDFAARTQPAMEISGDFIDWVELSDGSLYFSLGDITGKGIAAGLLASSVRTALRSKVRGQEVLGPEHLLGQVTEELYDDFTDVGSLATVFTGRYWPTSQEVFFANAGHSPVLFYDGEKMHILASDGPALGVLPESVSRGQRLSITEGCALIIASDGFVECCDDQGEQWGIKGFADYIEKLLARCSAQEIIRKLYEQITKYYGHRPLDDMSLLLLLGNEVEERGQAQALHKVKMGRDTTYPDFKVLRNLARSILSHYCPGLKEVSVYKILLALQELAVNICEHALEDLSSEDAFFEVTLGISPDHRILWAEFVDFGKELPEEDWRARFDHVGGMHQGGYGLYLITTIAKTNYLRDEDGSNCWRLEFVLTS